MKRRVLFFVEFDTSMKISWDELEIGNPGVGGTQYTTLCLAKELLKFSNYEVKIVCNSHLDLGGSIDVLQLPIVQAVDYAEKHEFVLVYRPTINFDPLLLQKLKTTEASVVAWAHVGPSQETLRTLSELASIKKVVALGERELISWFDNPVIRKSVLIRNGHHIPKFHTDRNPDADVVTYIGSLVPQKGFHLLAEVWPHILKLQPSLRLNVVGSGNLYSNVTGLGRLGIAAPDYEDLIIRNLGDSINSVKFLGKLGGEEKNSIVASSFIGVINPSGNTENCPLSALDFQSLSVPVLSAKKFGVIDTVRDGKTGLLFRNYNQLPKIIDLLVRNPSIRETLSANCKPFIEERFNFHDVSKQWDCLFDNLSNAETTTKFLIRDAVSIHEFLTIINGNFLLLINYRLRWFTIQEIKSSAKRTIRSLQRLLTHRMNK